MVAQVSVKDIGLVAGVVGGGQLKSTANSRLLMQTALTVAGVNNGMSGMAVGYLLELCEACLRR
jgi:hypothetical protein